MWQMPPISNSEFYFHLRKSQIHAKKSHNTLEPQSSITKVYFTLLQTETWGQRVDMLIFVFYLEV